jgi:hypothetical protein
MDYHNKIVEAAERHGYNDIIRSFRDHDGVPVQATEVKMYGVRIVYIATNVEDEVVEKFIVRNSALLFIKSIIHLF